MRIALKRPWPPARLDASHTSNHLRQQFSGQADIPGTRLTDFFCSLEKGNGCAATLYGTRHRAPIARRAHGYIDHSDQLLKSQYFRPLLINSLC